jgi:hypothetical protein
VLGPTTLCDAISVNVIYCSTSRVSLRSTFSVADLFWGTALAHKNRSFVARTQPNSAPRSNDRFFVLCRGTLRAEVLHSDRNIADSLRASVIPTEGNWAGTLGGRPGAQRCSVDHVRIRSFLATSHCCTIACSISRRSRSEELISEFKTPSTHRGSVRPVDPTGCVTVLRPAAGVIACFNDREAGEEDRHQAAWGRFEEAA